ncbi:MAG: acyl-CoA desaturase [Ktedonobacterales bacterium]
MRHTLARHIYQTIVLLTVIVPLLATGLAVRLLWQRAVHWSDLVLLATMYTLVAIGVTVGYHRMLTHRSFTPHPVVKFVLLVLGSMALEGDAIQWTATHTKHHALADRPGDPHSPLDGFFHAHLGWIFAETDADPRRYCRHLLRDRLVLFVSRTHLLWVVLAMAIPFAIGGVFGGWAGALTGLLWGGLVRQFLTHHVTWSVNSICHTFGKRAFETNDASRNEWIVGLLALGEGWHNNHHAFPRSAFHGLRWWQFDLAGYVIRLLERLGLAHDVYRITPAMQAARLAPPAMTQSVPPAAALEERSSA